MTDKNGKSQSDNKKSNGDSELWDRAMHDVTPLKGKNITPRETPKEKPKKHIQTQHNTKDTPPEPVSTTPETHHYQIDRRTAQRLKRGQISIEGRLDLHGKTQNEAYDALLRFIPSAAAQGKRCVLVITGKGGGRDSSISLADRQDGILKQKTPEWLNSPPLNQHVLKTETARPNHGGEGALYVLLRRQR